MQPKPVEEPEAMPPPPRGALNPYIVEQSVGSIKAVGVATVHSAMAIGTTTMSRVASAGSLVVTGLEKTGVTAGFQAVFGKGIDKSDAGLEASTHSRRHVRLNGRRCESSQSHQPFRTRERLPAVGKVLRGSGVPCRCARLAPAPWPVRCGVWASRHGHAPRPWARCKVSSISTGT